MIKRKYFKSLFIDFFESEKTGGLILIFATLASLIISNSRFHNQYLAFWQFQIGTNSIEFWINEGLMTLFFLMIGLELERELISGELSHLKKATFPIYAAIGGMIVPAILFLIINHGLPTQKGLGIPMATDIAFSLGILSLFGNKIPLALKIFLTALAVIDDLGAILMIAIFYSQDLQWLHLLVAAVIFMILYIFNKLHIKHLSFYLCGGFLMWVCLLHSGIHATITGILLAFVIPYDGGKKTSSSYILQKNLHLPVAFIILPLFAMANTCMSLDKDIFLQLKSPLAIGIMSGLLIGKPLGILSFAAIGNKFKICLKPKNIKWGQLIGVGILAGIGFTMSIFATLIAFENPIWVKNAKTAILVASTLAGILGYSVLSLQLKTEKNRK